MTGNRLCVVCCYSFVSVKQESERTFPVKEVSGEGNVKQRQPGESCRGEPIDDNSSHLLTLFCNQLDLVTFTESSKDYSTNGFFKSLKSFQSNLSICPDCTCCISAAIVTKIKLEKIETHVNQLQMKILAELKELQCHVERFYVEVNKLDGLVGMSDKSCLETCIERQLQELAVANVNMCQEGTNSSQIFFFRNRISDLASDLKFYHEGLIKRMIGPSIHERQQSQNRQKKTDWGLGRSSCKKVKMSDEVTLIKRRRKKSVIKNTTGGSESDDKLPDDTILMVSSNEVSENEETGSGYGINSTCNPDGEDWKQGSTYEGCKRIETNHVKKKRKKNDASPRTTFKDRVISRAEKRLKTTKNQQVPSKPEDSTSPQRYHIEYSATKDVFTLAGIEVIVDNDEETLECSLCAYRPKMAPRTSRRPLVEKYMERYMFSHILGKHLDAFNCQFCEASFQSYKSFQNHLLKHKSKKGKEKLHCTAPAQARINPKKSKKRANSSFSDRFRSRAQKKVNTNQKLREQAPSYLKDDPIYRYHIEYNEEEKSFSLAGIQIILNEQEENVQCGLCGYRPLPKTVTKKGSKEHYMDKSIYGHILGKHVGVFRCSFCGANMQSHWRFREHLKMHNEQFVCDICGKPLKTKGIYESHRWLHLSEEEKAEAIQNGQKNPLERQESLRNVTEKLFQCMKCGKDFKTRMGLSRHESTHESFENRKRVVCPKCGKMVLRTVYDTYHRKYGCPGIPAQNLSCPHCNLTLKNVLSFNRHIKRLHSATSTERPYFCDICGKDYKAQSDLKTHQKIHEQASSWTCGKGCGREFNVRRNWRRHEIACKGVGTHKKLKKEDGSDEEQRFIGHLEFM